MAKVASIGEMRTRIVIREITSCADADGFAAREYTDVFSGPVWCKWVWAHGSEALENMRLEMGQTATVTMPYTPKVSPRCRIWRAGEENDEDAAWDVVSVNNVEDANRYLEVRARKKVKA